MKNLFSIIILLITLTKSYATDWCSVVDLKGMWSFTVGDNMKWSEINTDTKDWDRINVPDKWEVHYEGYNGYAWYRKNFDIQSLPNGQLVLLLGQIDDVDEVFINGIKIGQTGSFLPNYKTAYNIDRNYIIPEGILKEQKNVIAIRVYDEGIDGGIVKGDKIGIFYDNDKSLLSLDMSGKWKFSFYREKGIFDSDFDDSKWNTINVPGYWDTQGYYKDEGLAWYRTKFTVPNELKNDDIYLVLGRIDDYDKVYLNGSLIGRTEYLDVYNKLTHYKAHRFYRVYKIPVNKLNTVNVLVVEVRNSQLVGGIYDGPIGLMNYRNAKIIEERNEDEVWDNPFRAIIRFFDW